MSKYVKYIVGGSMVALGIVICLIAGCFGGFRVFTGGGIYMDSGGIHIGGVDYNYETTDKTFTSGDIAGVKKLRADLDYANVEIKTSDTSEIKVEAKGINSGFSAEIKGDTLSVGFSRFTFFLISCGGASGDITIVLPETLALEEAEIITGAGTLNINGLNAGEIKIDSGAGEVVMNDIKAAKRLYLSTGAGAVTVNGAECGEVNVASGVGKVTFTETRCAGLEVDTGVGEFVYSGEANGDIDIDSGVGAVRIELKGDPEDYDFDVDSGLGAITVNGERYYPRGGKYKFKIDSGVGEVRIVYS